MRLGVLLEDWRWMKKLSPTAAAEEIGVPVSAITQLEAGRDVQGRNLGIILTWLLSDATYAEIPPQQLALEPPQEAADG